MLDQNICLAGDGWGATAAFNSLKRVWKRIDLMTSDSNILEKIDSTYHRICKFDETDSDIVICAGYKPIIDKEQLEEKTFINIHYSLLPKYRGQHSTVWAILNDESNLGLTIHEMNEYIDDGPIIFQHSVLNDKISTSLYYMEYFNRWIEANLAGIVIAYKKKEILPVAQDKSLATWVGRRRRIDCKINFHKGHTYLKNFFRALVSPYPFPYIVIEKDKTEYSILEATFLERRIESHIGRVVNIDSEGVYVSSQDGYVVLKKIHNQDGVLIDYNIFKIGSYLNQEFR